MQIDTQIASDIAALDKLIDLAGPLCTSWDIIQSCPDTVKHAKSELRQKKVTRTEHAESVDKLQERIDDKNEELVCLEKKAGGETCTYMDLIPDVPGIEDLRQSLDDVNDGISNFSENLIDLLVSLLLKTVAIPLLFLYLLVRVVRYNWARI